MTAFVGTYLQQYSAWFYEMFIIFNQFDKADNQQWQTQPKGLLLHGDIFQYVFNCVTGIIKLAAG